MKLDLTKTFKTYYTAKSIPELLELEAARYISISGVGDPSGADFANRVQALYATAYTIKFACKEMDEDFVVAKLEGQWWYADKYKDLTMAEAPTKVPRNEWHYRLLIRMPYHVTKQMIANAARLVGEKKQLTLAGEVSLHTIPGQTVIQILHTGPFDKEPETLVKLQQFVQEHKLEQAGLHHEVYLSDFRKTAPEKLRTILREPVKHI